MSLLQRIRETATDDPDEDQPTPYALALAEVLISAVDPIPHAAAAPWEDGSIYVYWRNEQRQLHLRVAASEAQDSYMYHCEDKDYGIDHNVTPLRVAEWVRWYGESL